MDAKPKSNKIKRTARKRKLEQRAELRSRSDVRTVAATRALLAERALKAPDSCRRATKQLLERIFAGQTVQAAPNSELFVVAKLFEGIHSRKFPGGRLLKRDIAALQHLVLVCHEHTSLFKGVEANRYANALLALCAWSRWWMRPLENWKPPSYNNDRNFQALVRYLIAVYDVPKFMNNVWLEGLTPASVVHQRWFIHIAQGQNIRTADGLPVSLSKRRAHYFLEAPDDFDVLSAFRWAEIIDLGGTERLVRSVLATRIGTDFGYAEFWESVLCWLVSNPMLDPAHHGPIIDYLYNQRFVASVPNPLGHLPGQPRLIAPQPNLTMKGRNADTLLRAVEEWHRLLGRDQSRRAISWGPSGIPSFRFEEGEESKRRVYTITELLSSRDLDGEGRAMSHCVGTYAASCASGRISIWSLKIADDSANEARLLTIEVWNSSRQIVQARQKFNKQPSSKELMILNRWATAGGPSLSKLLPR